LPSFGKFTPILPNIGKMPSARARVLKSNALARKKGTGFPKKRHESMSRRISDARPRAARFAAALLALACLLPVPAALAETVKVADCRRDSSIDAWSAPAVEFSRRIVDEVFRLAGVEAETVPCDGETLTANAEVIRSAFRTPALLEKYDFPLQPLGVMHYALYATEERAPEMLSTLITDWPRMKVAYSPAAQGRTPDREAYFEHAGLSPEFVEYPTGQEAEAALRRGEADVLFLYSPREARPKNLVEVVPIGMRNVYFAVRKDRPDLFKRLNEAWRNWYIDEIASYDRWREELMGTPPPARRVRLAAYQRGDLFSVSPDGIRSGSIEEWMRSLAVITGWDIDYVYGLYEESLDDVKNGRLDLVGGVGFTPERLDEFHFPHTPVGMLRVYLWARPNSPYQPGRPATWRGMRVGSLVGTFSGERVKELLASRPQDIELVEYPSNKALMDAYFSGEIDGCVNIETSELANEKALRIYASHPMYLVSRHGDDDLFLELERALDAICDDFPKYMRMISERHYGAHSELSELTVEEIEWLENRARDPAPVVVDFSPWPFPLRDGAGEPTGFPRALLEELTRKTGLAFELSEQTGIQTAEAKFMRGDVDFWIPYPARANPAFRAVKVFSLPVPRQTAELCGVDDPREEMEMVTRPGTPVELETIIGKIVSGIEPDRLQEMFLTATVARVVEREKRFLGMTTKELGELAVSVGVVVGALVLLYGAAMLVLLKKQARRAREEARRAEGEARRAEAETARAEKHAARAQEEARRAEVEAARAEGEARRAEGEAARAEELAQAKSRFLAMMSHELRTPLNAVIGFAEFLGRELEAHEGSEERRKEYVEGILTSATALLELINDILDLSKLESGAVDMRSGTCSPEAIARELPAIFGYRVAKSGVTLSVRRVSGPEVPQVVLARQGFRQILLNLVGNAAKFTTDGEIAVEYAWIPETRTLRVEIRDTGCGISEAKMAQLWDPFVQDIASRMTEGDAKTRGSGLGLPIVKRLVDNAGGTIRVESAPGRGTRFVVELPGLELSQVLTAPEDRPLQGLRASANPAKGARDWPGKVLVVDDMLLNRKVLSIHLEKLGVKEVRQAVNGKEALDILGEWLPDVVLTDMWMPEMDGQRLAERMRENPRYASVPIVVVTADVEAGTTHELKLFSAVMAKPVTGAKLSRVFLDLQAAAAAGKTAEGKETPPA